MVARQQDGATLLTGHDNVAFCNVGRTCASSSTEAYCHRHVQSLIEQWLLTVVRTASPLTTYDHKLRLCIGAYGRCGLHRQSDPTDWFLPSELLPPDSSCLVRMKSRGHFFKDPSASSSCLQVHGHRVNVGISSSQRTTPEGVTKIWNLTIQSSRLTATRVASYVRPSRSGTFWTASFGPNPEAS